MRYDHFHLLPIRAFMRVGGRMTLEGGGKGDEPDAPDYSQMAAASEKAATLGYKLGTEQLTESKRQYDENMAVAKPIVEAQAGLARQSIEQGNDYYEYMKANQRPVEESLNAEAMAAGTEQKQEEAADKAQADSLQGFTKSANIVARQGLRYGASPEKLAKANNSMSASMASGIASAAGSAREKEAATGYAKKMDVAGLYRNLAGASQGSYGLALNAGNSATSNQMAPGQAKLNGMAQGTSTIMQGTGQQMQGLSSIMNTQAGIYNANQPTDNTGALIGAVGGVAAKAIPFLMSSKSLKENKKPVDSQKIVDSLQRIPVEAWKYKDGVSDSGEHVGPYAEDVNREFGDTAAPGGKVLDVMTMNGLTLSAVKNLADRMDRVERKSGLQRKGK